MNNDDQAVGKGDWGLGEARKSLVGQETRKELPSFILEVVATEVQYTIPPSQLPLKHVEFKLLSSVLSDELGLRFKLPDFDRVLAAQKAGVHIDALDEESMGKLLLGLDSPTLIFEAGRIVSDEGEHVVIERVRLDEESVFARVRGTTRVAEVVAQQVAEWVWQAARMRRSWRQIEPHVQLIAYGAGTKTELGVPFKMILAPEVRGFLQDQVLAGTKYAAFMGNVPPEYNADFADCIFSVGEVVLMFHRFDRTSGRPERQEVRINVTAKSEHGTGVVRIESALDLERHVAMVGELREALRACDQK